MFSRLVGAYPTRCLQPQFVSILGERDTDKWPLKLAGSAWFYKTYHNELLFVTAAHIIREDIKCYWLNVGSGELFRANVIGVDNDYDVAVLSIKCIEGDLEFAQPAIRSTPISEGEIITLFACSQLTLRPVRIQGAVAQGEQLVLDSFSTESRIMYVQTDMTTLPGFSGCAVVDKNDQFIGMMAKKFQEYGLAIPSTIVTAIADSLIEGTLKLPVHLGLRVQCDCMRLGLNRIIGGLRVINVEQGSIAEKVGLRNGDLITKINEKVCIGHPCQLTQELLTNRTIQLQVRRDEQIIEIELHLNQNNS